ncbi:MAG TPA: hypothetical protein VGL64_19045 [Amycolatopsis sp.]|jgi:hypothetical protein
MLDDPIATTPRPPGWGGFVLTLTLISVLGAVFSAVLSVASVMSSDGCFSGDTRFICTADGQQTVFWLPWIGWAAAILGSLITAGWASRKGWGPWAGLFAGMLLYGVAALVTHGIVDG